MGLLLRLHTLILAYFVKFFRIRATLKVFRESHSLELSQTPMNMWPLTMGRQARELDAVRAGKLEAVQNPGIVDRKSWAWPFLPSSVNRLAVPILKSSPYNLRRMSRTPVPRRAINLIKGAIISQPWDIRPIEGTDIIDDESEDDQKERIHIAKKIFTHPNNQDSFQTFVEMGIEDMCVLGAFCAELTLSLDPERPLKSWNVNVDSVRIFPSWSESLLDMPHYAQMTGLKGERGAILFYDDEMLYIKDNPSTDNPFGLGKMEIGFMSISDLIGVQGMAGRAGADQIHKTFLWWSAPQSESAYQIVRRHIQNELEGQAKLSIIGGMQKPDVVDVNPVKPEDLLLDWQEMLIRMIANAFDMSAMALGVEHDVNRAVGEVLNDKDFRSAVVPMARRLMEGFTRKILHNKLGWYDLEFAFLNLDDPDAETKMGLYSKMYSANAITPNQIRKGMMMEPLDSPFADLTQFECMLLNIEAMGNQQDKQADHAAQRQMAVQQMMQPPEQPQEPGATPDTQEQRQIPGQPPPKQLGPGRQPPPQGGGGGMTPGSAAKGGQPPSPKPLSLPKFPIAGSKYTAKQVAMMPINQVQDVYKASGLGASEFLTQMDDQEPGILQELREEIREFFEQELEEEQKKPKKKTPPKLLEKWRKELAIKLRQDNKRPKDFGIWQYKHGVQVGKPGGPTKVKPGKPGAMNRITPL
jgi:portal protein